MQYGIRISNEDLRVSEFLRLLSGVMPDTPLGKVVGIRAEKNPEIIRKFTVSEKKIRGEWQRFSGDKRSDGVDFDIEIKKLESMLESMFGAR